MPELWDKNRLISTYPRPECPQLCQSLLAYMPCMAFFRNSLGIFILRRQCPYPCEAGWTMVFHLCLNPGIVLACARIQGISGPRQHSLASVVLRIVNLRTL